MSQPAAWEAGRVRAELGRLLGSGVHKKEAARQVAQLANWPQRDVYRLATEANEPEDGHEP